jgi:hypothetical protein
MQYSPEYLASPLTAAKFDRTVNQLRQTVGRLVAWCGGAADFGDLATTNQILTDGFMRDVAWDIRDRKLQLIREAVSGEHPGASGIDGGALALVARHRVLAELTELDAALPHPALDKLAESPV